MTTNLLTKTFITIISLSINFLFADLIQTVEFDSTDVSTTTEQIIILSNTGDLPLAIYSVSLSSETDSFQMVADTNYTINSGEKVNIILNFIPKQAGDHSATLNIQSNDEENSDVTLNLTGYANETASTSVDDFNNFPTEFKLSQNYPNPFNPTTNVKYELPKDCKVDLTIYNIRGQKVATIANNFQTAGYHQVMWNGTNDLGQKVSSGVYFLRMQTEDFIKNKHQN